MMCGKSSVNSNLSVEDYTSQSSLHPLFLRDGFKTNILSLLCFILGIEGMGSSGFPSARIFWWFEH